jgi:hypothetical protein
MADCDNLPHFATQHDKVSIPPWRGGKCQIFGRDWQDKHRLSLNSDAIALEWGKKRRESYLALKGLGGEEIFGREARFTTKQDWGAALASARQYRSNKKEEARGRVQAVRSRRPYVPIENPDRALACDTFQRARRLHREEKTALPRLL